MSWSVNFIGKPENVAAALETASEKLSGQSKVEFDEAKPLMIGLVKQNFTDPAKIASGWMQPLVRIEASGSGSTESGKQVQRSCSVKVEPFYANLV